MCNAENTNFWKGKRVLITGHTGFKGSWLTLWLHKMGAELTGFSIDIPTVPSMFESAQIGRVIDSRTGDICDEKALKGVFESVKPEVVFHLAAQSLVRDSYQDPLSTFDVNVMGTAKVLETVRKCSCVKACVVVTSDKCYENKEWAWPYREYEPMGGYDAYSASKGCAELIVSAYRRSFFSCENGKENCAVASARAGNVIGGGDWAKDRLVPSILGNLSRNETVSIRSPDSVRPWQHVLEPLYGYIVLAEALWCGDPKYASGWNFGPADVGAKPVSWLVDSFVDHWGGGAWNYEKSDNLHEANLLRLDSAKARNELRWQPVWDVNMAIVKTIEWHKSWVSQGNMMEFSLDQIDQYSAEQQSISKQK